MIRNKSALDTMLNEPQRQVLEKYLSCCDSYFYLLVVHAFRKGFSLASKFFAETLPEYD